MNEKNVSRSRPRPMRVRPLVNLLFGATGILIVAAGTPCRVIEWYDEPLLGAMADPEANWITDMPDDWESYLQ